MPVVLTKDKVARRVEKIRRLVDDEEVAHYEEDKLYVDVLRAISKGVENPQELATEALEAYKIGFQRWYS